MKRRALLGSVVSLALAGCLEADDAGSTTSTETTTHGTRSTQSTTGEPTGSTTDQPTESTSAADPRTLGVPVEQVDSPFESDGNVERVVWYPDQPDAALSLTPETDEVTLPEAETTFTLSNDTGSDFSLNLYDWALHKHVDGQWFFVTPQVVPAPLHVLPAGDAHEWEFTVDNTREASSGHASTETATVAGLGGGEYAFEVSGWFETGGHEQHVGVGARFRVDGEPLALDQPGDVSVTRDSDTVIASLDSQDGDPTAALVVEHVGQAGVPPEQPIEEFVAEQLVRPGPGSERTWLWDAFALFDGDVEEVRVESASDIDLGRLDADERQYVEFRDRIYEVEVVEVE